MWLDRAELIKPLVREVISIGLFAACNGQYGSATIAVVLVGVVPLIEFLAQQTAAHRS